MGFECLNKGVVTDFNCLMCLMVEGVAKKVAVCQSWRALQLGDTQLACHRLSNGSWVLREGEWVVLEEGDRVCCLWMVKYLFFRGCCDIPQIDSNIVFNQIIRLIRSINNIIYVQQIQIQYVMYTLCIQYTKIPIILRQSNINLADMIILAILLMGIAMVGGAQMKNSRQNKQIISQLFAIDNRLQILTKSNHQPKYTIFKLEHSILQQKQKEKEKEKEKHGGDCRFHQQYAQSGQYNKRQRYELIASISIYEGESVSYPALVRHCNSYYSIKGHKIAQFQPNPTSTSTLHYRHFISSVRSQFTYFAEVQWPIDCNHNTHNATVNIHKLQLNNRKIGLSLQHTLQIPLIYGTITGFANSFSLSLRLFAFATHTGRLLFYRTDGRLQTSIDLPLHHNLQHGQMGEYQEQQQQQEQQEQQEQQNKLDVRITKLNNHLAVYTHTFNSRSFLFSINTNGKNSTLRRYTLPKLTHNYTSMVLKYNDNNWHQFYVAIHNTVYAYQIKSSSASQVPTPNNFDSPPSHSYPLIKYSDSFYIAGTMLIVQSISNHSVIWYYYNLTDGSASPLKLPPFCRHQLPQISISSQSLGSHIICVFCADSYQCYSIFANTDPIFNKTEYTDYSKFRVPLVLLSLGIVIFISVTRGRKSQTKSLSEEKEQQNFMRELERKDKRLYEELSRSRKGNTANTMPKQTRSRVDQPSRSTHEDRQSGQRMGKMRVKYS